MKRPGIFLLGALFLLLANAEPAGAQTAADPNAGSRLEWDNTNSIWRFKWWAKDGNTYFIQHSEDLQQWFWVPVVEAGDDSVREWGFTSTSDKFFLRLRYTDVLTGDPEGGDFDGDGISNLVEVQAGGDPFNYYNQAGVAVTPVISIVSGNNQTLSPGGFSGPLTVKVTNGISGPALPNAPVTFSVAGGSEALAQSPTEVAEFFSTLTLRTDPLTGEISNPQDKVHVRLPSAPSSLVQINAAAAGSLSGFVGLPVQFTVYNYNPFVPPAAPTGLAITANEDGSLTYTWQDHSDSETGFTVEYQLSDGSWASLGSAGPNATSLTVSAVTVVGLGLTPASNTRAIAINGAGPSGSGDSEPKLRTWRASFEFHLDDDYGATYIFLAKSLATLRDEWQLYQPAAYVAAHDTFVNDLPNLDYGPSSGGPGWAEAMNFESVLAADVFTHRHHSEFSPYHGCQDTSGSWSAFQVSTSQPVETAYSASYLILKNKSAEFEEPAFEALGTARFDILAGKTLANLTLEGVEESGDVHGDEHTLYLEPEPKYNLNNYNEWTSRNNYLLIRAEFKLRDESKINEGWDPPIAGDVHTDGSKDEDDWVPWTIVAKNHLHGQFNRNELTKIVLPSAAIAQMFELAVEDASKPYIEINEAHPGEPIALTQKETPIIIVGKNADPTTIFDAVIELRLKNDPAHKAILKMRVKVVPNLEPLSLKFYFIEDSRFLSNTPFPGYNYADSGTEIRTNIGIAAGMYGEIEGLFRQTCLAVSFSGEAEYRDVPYLKNVPQNPSQVVGYPSDLENNDKTWVRAKFPALNFNEGHIRTILVHTLNEPVAYYDPVLDVSFIGVDHWHETVTDGVMDRPWNPGQNLTLYAPENAKGQVKSPTRVSAHEAGHALNLAARREGDPDPDGFEGGHDSGPYPRSTVSLMHNYISGRWLRHEDWHVAVEKAFQRLNPPPNPPPQ